MTEVYTVRPNPGDGGIDVLVKHNDNNETIVQCKFFKWDRRIAATTNK